MTVGLPIERICHPNVTEYAGVGARNPAGGGYPRAGSTEVPKARRNAAWLPPTLCTKTRS